MQKTRLKKKRFILLKLENLEKNLADENIPYLAVKGLKEKLIDIISVIDIQRGLGDQKIIEYAFEKDLIIITYDKDFGELVFKNKFQSKGVILLRVIFNSYKDLENQLYLLITNNEIIKYNNFITVKKNYIRVRNV